MWHRTVGINYVTITSALQSIIFSMLGLLTTYNAAISGRATMFVWELSVGSS